MAKDLRISFLLDFYGDMLTETQREVVDAYYNEDLSLAEIAQDREITRQGVRDAIKRAEQQLLEMEERLGLARRFQDIQKALTLICDYESSRLYIVSLDTTRLEALEVPADINWAMLVAYNRGRMEKIQGTPFYNRYRDLIADKDLIVGCIANDRMFYVIDNFFIGNITDAALVHSLSALQLGKQYVAVSQKACDAVRIEREISLSYLERLFLKEVAEENRTAGVSLANDICRNYRREGLFFDEILDGVTPGGD